MPPPHQHKLGVPTITGNTEHILLGAECKSSLPTIATGVAGTTQTTYAHSMADVPAVRNALANFEDPADHLMSRQPMLILSIRTGNIGHIRAAHATSLNLQQHLTIAW